MKTYRFEMTDTFGGEANYSWARRGEVEAKTDLGAIRKAKAALGLETVRCKKEELGDVMRLSPVGACLVIFLEEVTE